MSSSTRSIAPAILLSRPSLLLAGVILCIAILFSHAFVAPARQQDDEVVRVSADLVVLNVTVIDAAGKYVHRVPRSVFTVFEDESEQKITTFSAEETPFAVALLLDSSGSMEGRISLARAAAINFLDGMRADDVAAIYHFDTKVERLQDFSPGRDLPPIAYDVKAKGWTVLNDAIVRASVDLSQRPEKRRAIVVLSDGADTRSRASSDKALASALAANATIYTVDMSPIDASAINKQASAGALRNFAAKSGGKFVATPGGKALSEAFKGIVEELRNQYTIGYQPTNRAHDGRWRAVEVRVARSSLSARTRRGYRAPK